MSDRSTIVVTGASSGIGKATAALLADRGHHVYAAARDTTALAHLAENHLLKPLHLDITDPVSVAAAHERIDSDTEGRGPDVVINAAGIAVLGPVESLPDTAVRRQFDTNVFGTLAVTRAFLPSMRERCSGRIVNVSSILGRFTLPGTGVYAASKYALEAVSDALRVELAPFGVDVVVVEPGIVATPLYDHASAAALEYAEQLAPYADLFPHGIDFPDKLARGALTVGKVAKTIADAATVPHPKPRYIPGRRNRFNIALLTALPTSATDRSKSKLMELDTAAVRTDRQRPTAVPQ
jgi:NAD(P)-dependent dehydrogenase (short-subunit alcohol dehydrogenase family)